MAEPREVDAFFVVSKRSDGQGFDRSGKFFRTICSGSKSDARGAGGAAYESRGGNFGNGGTRGLARMYGSAASGKVTLP
jgi:hypothetical protein